MANYRILSLDGGGAWALIQVKALIALYDVKTTGHEVLSDFDLVAANSGGSIVLGGLVEDIALGELLGYFQNETKRRSVFSPTSFWSDSALSALTGIGPKYSEKAKLPALETLFSKRGDVKLPDAAAGIRRTGSSIDVHLLIVGFDYDRNRATFFRSTGFDSPAWGKGDVADVTLAEAIHASSNAPVNYFDGPACFLERTDRYWDGGITGCNNPVLAAVTEAITLGQNASDLSVLSIGTATVSLPLQQKDQADSPFLQPRSDDGLINDLQKLAKAILDDPPDIASFLAHVMTGGPSGLKAPITSRVVRMNPLISPIKDISGNWVAPEGMTKSQFSYIASLDMDAVEQHQVDMISNFADLWLKSKVPNQPIRKNGDTFKSELGQAWFQEAFAAWQTIKAGGHLI